MFKTFLFVVGLALIAPAAHAQATPAASAAKAPQYEHCILVLSWSRYDGKEIRLEFGKDLKNVPQNPELIKADAVVQKLGSVVAALNYMSSQGWECISVNTLPGSTPYTGYLLRRAK